MCPITLAALGTVMAGGSAAVGTGAAAGIIAGAGATATTGLGASLFAGMSTAALGFSTLTTGLSLGTSLYGAKAAADQAEAQNKAQRLRHNATVKASNDALSLQYQAMGDRQMQENRASAQQQQERQRAYEDAMGDLTASAAETGTTGVNLEAIRQSLDMEMGRGNVSLAENLKWRQRQFQSQQQGYRATAKGRQLQATPQYEAPPSRVMGPLLGTAGAGMANLGKFGGPDWMSGLSAKYAE